MTLGSVAVGSVGLPQPDPTAPIVVDAQSACRWQQGAHEVWVLGGGVQLEQGQRVVSGEDAVLWIDRAGPLDRGRTKVIAYLEGDVRLEHGSQEARAGLNDKTWLGRLETTAEADVRAMRLSGMPQEKPAIYQRGMARRTPIRDGAIRRTQYAESQPGLVGAEGLPSGSRRIRVFPRSDVPVQAQWFPDRDTNQWIAVIDSGVNLIVDGLEQFGSLDVSADRLVIWTTGMQEPDLTGKTFQDETIPLEIYMEGNIVFRQGERIIYADRMYYDVTNRTGRVLQAEILSPVPNYEGLLRLRAQIVQQIDRGRFFAENAYITSSRMGQPSYRLQTGTIYFEDIQQPVRNPFTGAPQVDPATGEPVIYHERLATAENTLLFLGDLPVFYWPRFATDLTEPSFYIRRAQLKNDSVFGTQVLTNWNVYELLGLRRRPEGTKWDLNLDYLSQRGFGHGTTFTYSRDDFFVLPGRSSGLFDFWGIEDHGKDNLGAGRRSLSPAKDYRHRMLWKHRQLLPQDFQLTAELGWVSDRNFLEQYYEREWDEQKDQTTNLELKRTRDNTSWSILVGGRLNPFFTQTEWLPRLDHFWLGQPLMNDAFTWYEHSQASYARLQTASVPENPSEQAKFAHLPWETSPRSGERLMTRQELDWPIQLGPVKAVPYALGELAHWGEALDGDDAQRAYWQAGVRTSMPAWRVYPNVENRLFNVHGLAHKMVFDAEFLFAQSNLDLEDLPLYEPLDDDSIEAFRRRFQFNTFGGPPIPRRFDERLYALRTGMAGSVTAPSAEIADDLMALRAGLRQRWQTKRGRPGSRTTVDWIVLDLQGVWFPDEMRDNFGKAFGLYEYDFLWNVGDRLTLVSDGIFDFFDDGQQAITVGGHLSRPPRGNLYLGVRFLNGPIDSSILSMSYSYRMSPKWVSSFGMSVDLAKDGNIGQNFSITRIGESLLITAGFNVDASRDSVGVHLAIEPRFLPRTSLGRVGGAQIPVAGAYGLE